MGPGCRRGRCSTTGWCGQEDSNFHGLSATTTSTLRVYQFRHGRTTIMSRRRAGHLLSGRSAAISRGFACAHARRASYACGKRTEQTFVSRQRVAAGLLAQETCPMDNHDNGPSRRQMIGAVGVGVGVADGRRGDQPPPPRRRSPSAGEPGASISDPRGKYPIAAVQATRSQPWPGLVIEDGPLAPIMRRDELQGLGPPPWGARRLSPAAIQRDRSRRRDRLRPRRRRRRDQLPIRPRSPTRARSSTSFRAGRAQGGRDPRRPPQMPLSAGKMVDEAVQVGSAGSTSSSTMPGASRATKSILDITDDAFDCDDEDQHLRAVPWIDQGSSAPPARRRRSSSARHRSRRTTRARTCTTMPRPRRRR